MTTIYTPAQLNDHGFYMAHRADILAAIGEGRIAGYATPEQARALAALDAADAKTVREAAA